MSNDRRIQMGKGIIYYTDNRPRLEYVLPVVQNQILKSGLTVTSVSLRPINFGNNISIKRHPGYVTMLMQIILALENSTSDIVFFCEHDVLYHSSHFDFTPSRNDIYYYNVNNWKWMYPNDIAVTYDGLHSLSMLCCNRELALSHFRYRLPLVEKLGGRDGNNEPRWGQVIGFEPGTKKINRGGITDEDFEVWRSPYSNIDIRYSKNFTRKNRMENDLDSSRHTGWKKVTLNEIEGWTDIREMFYISKEEYENYGIHDMLE
jgi:hypothetical protein